MKGTWRECSLAGDPEGYVEDSGDGNFFPWGSLLGNLEEGSSTGDFEGRMKGALGLEQLSLKRLSAGGLRGISFTGDPGRYVKKVSRYGYLSPWGPLSIRGESGMWGLVYRGL